jgi:hypothetical protein
LVYCTKKNLATLIWKWITRNKKLTDREVVGLRPRGRGSTTGRHFWGTAEVRSTLHVPIARFFLVQNTKTG